MRGNSFRWLTPAVVLLRSDRSAQVSLCQQIRIVARGLHSSPIAHLSARGSSLRGQTLPAAPSRSAEERPINSFPLTSPVHPGLHSSQTALSQIHGNSLRGEQSAHSLHREERLQVFRD